MTHATDSNTCIEDVEVTVDELWAKSFGIIRSPLLEFVPHGKSEWISAINQVPKIWRGKCIFGSSGEVLFAAGIDPDFYFGRWKRRKARVNRKRYPASQLR